MSFYNDRDYRPQGSGVAWKRGMPLGEGKKHDSYMTGRIDASRLYSVDGTVQNPKVHWLAAKPSSIAVRVATENLARQEAINFHCGITHVWIMMAGHSETTYGRKQNGDRTMVSDDRHMTVRMGTASDVINLSGHLYFKTDTSTDHGKPVAMMTDDERSFQGTSARTLWVWGSYPGHLPREHPHPRPPFFLKPGRTMPGAG